MTKRTLIPTIMLVMAVLIVTAIFSQCTLDIFGTGSIKVEFRNYNGEYISSGMYDIGDTPSPPNIEGLVPPTGAVFLGWDRDINATNPGGIEPVVNATGIVYYTIFVNESDAITITYISESTNEQKSINYNKNYSFRLPYAYELNFYYEEKVDQRYWINKSSNKEYNASDNFSSDISLTLYAKWENVYNVTYTAYGKSDNLPETTSYFENDAVYPSFSIKPELEGNTFTGWYRRAPSGNTGFEYSSDSGKYFMMPAYDITLYALYKDPIFLYKCIDFGETIFDSPMLAASHSLVISPTLKTGYSFVEWNTSEDGSGKTYSPSEQLFFDQDIILYAIRTPDPHTVTYYANYGTSEIYVENVVYDQNYTVNCDTFSREGYTLEGWHTDSNCTIKSTSPIIITVDLEYYAKWTPNSHTVRYNSNYPSGPTHSVDVKYDDIYTINHSVEREGYTFDGWYTEDNTLAPTSVTIKGDINYYAKWIANSHTLTLNYYEGATVTHNVFYDQEFDLSQDNVKPERTGYTFVNWSLKSGTGQSTYTINDKVLIKGDVVLDANWTINKYNVTYKSEHHEDVIVSDIEYGSLYTIENKFSKEDMDIIGWDITGNATTKAETGVTITITGETILTAAWEYKKYTIFMYVDGYSAYKYENINHGSSIKLDFEPTKTGYTLQGWSDDPSVNTVKYTVNSDITVTSDVNLYAVFTINQYNVTFSSGKEGIGSVVHSYDYNTKIKLSIPSTFVTKEQEVIGWDANSLPYAVDYEYTVTSDVTFIAAWDDIIYTITLTDGENSKTLTSKYNETVLLSSYFVKTRHHVNYWSDSPTGEKLYDVDYMLTVTENITLYAIWIPDVHYITYKVKWNESDISETKISVEYDGIHKIQPYTLIEKEGHEVIGWYYDESLTSECIVGSEFNCISDITIHGKWKLKQYDVLFILDDTTTKTHTVDYGTVLSIPSDYSLKTGYTHKHWLYEADNITYSSIDNITITKNLTLKAVWIPIVYKITYHINNGTDTMVSEKSGEYGSEHVVLGGVFDRKGYSITKWNRDSANSNISVEIGSKISIENDVDLYAVWERNTYSITFDGIYSEPVIISMKYEDTYTIPENLVTYDNHTLKYWSLTKFGEKAYNVGETITVLNDVKLYAVWDIETYNVELYSDNVKIDSLSGIYGYGSQFNVPLYSKTGYVLANWISGSVVYDVNDKITINSDIRLDAVWTIENYTLTYHMYDGTTVSSEHEYNTTVTINQNTLTRTGHTFEGWGLGQNSSVNYNPSDSLTIIGDTDLYDVWDPISYTVTFKGYNGETEIKTVDYGTVLALPSCSFEITGYTFSKWVGSDSVSYNVGTSITVTSNMTFTASWNVMKFTITYDSNMGGLGVTSDTVDYGTSVILSNKGFTFTGVNVISWNTNRNGTGTSYALNSSFEVTENVTLYAIWSKKIFHVIYTSDYHSDRLVPYEDGSTVTLDKNAFSKNNYTLIGWKESGSNRSLEYSFTITESRTFHAVWVKNYPDTPVITKQPEDITIDRYDEHSVSFDYNRNIVGEITIEWVIITDEKTIRLSGNTVLDLPIIVTAHPGTYTVYAEITNTDDSCTNNTITVKTSKATVKVNGEYRIHFLNTDVILYYTEGEQVNYTLNLTKTGYVLLKVISPENTELVNGDVISFIMPGKDLIYDTEWESVPLTVTYVIDDQVVSTESVDYEELIVVRNNNSDGNILCWSLNPEDRDGYIQGMNLKIESNLTLYAVFENDYADGLVVKDENGVEILVENNVSIVFWYDPVTYELFTSGDAIHENNRDRIVPCSINDIRKVIKMPA